MLWLYDDTLTPIRIVADYESVITTQRFFDYSEINCKIPASELASVLDARYLLTADAEDVYLCEAFEVVSEGIDSYITLKGRDALALLESRTLEGTFTYKARTHGYIVRDIIGNMTGDRALPLMFGDGISLGTSIDLQRSWGNAGEVVREVLASGVLAASTRLSGTSIVVDLYAPAQAVTFIGDRYRNASTGAYSVDETEWRNYAYVLGEQRTPTAKNVLSASIINGSNVSGSSANINAADSSLWTIGESNTTGLTVQFEFAVADDEFAGDFGLVGYYDGAPTAHYMELWAYDYTTSTWEELVEFFIPQGSTSGFTNSAPFAERHINRSTDRALFQLRHNIATYNPAHRLYLDRIYLTPGGTRERVEVDWTSGSPRRELYVDARDLQSTVNGTTLSNTEYRSILATRGAEKLAETRRVEYATATSTLKLTPGDVAWYDSGRWGAWLMVTESEAVSEKGTTRYTSVLGEPPATLRKTFRRMS